jgi:iron-sulfur cluster insertion protein
MVTITPVAEQKIHELMKEEKDIVGLRIYVRDGIRIQDGRGRYGH